MLGKLLKYEVRAMGRVMIPMYLAMLAVAAILGLSIRLRVNSALLSVLDKITVVSVIVLVICVAACGIAIVVLSIQRYYKNLLGTEGYLMFTIPTNSFSLICSKALSSLAWIVLGALVGLLAGFEIIAISGDLKSFLDAVGGDLQKLLEMLDAKGTGLIVGLIIMIILSIFASLCKVYASISIGHQFSNHRIIGSVAGYICIGLFETLMLRLVNMTGVMNGLIGEAAQVSELTGKVLTGGIIISLCQVLLYSFISWILIDRRLNLE